MIDWMCEHWIVTIVIAVLGMVAAGAIYVAIVAISILGAIMDAFFRRW